LPLSAAVNHPTLAHWRANVGNPVDLDLAGGALREATEIDVLCWNVAIGKGRLRECIETVRQLRMRTGIDRPFVALIQEAYRADESIPESHRSGHHGGHAPDNLREDVVETARVLGLSLRYSPSMRNGAHRSDRGNAILSSVAISQTTEITLPYVRQRRAAVAVKLALPFDLWFATAHLDTGGRHRPHPAQEIRATHRGFGAGRATQASALGDAMREQAGNEADIIIGGDLNSYLGLRDPAVRALVEHGFRHSERAGQWRHTFHGPIRLMLDHVLYRSCHVIEKVVVRRLDEQRDKTRRIFGSDHHPLLATVSIRRR
jgi:endonuclease/exonuclease/phosphatase family metal-dependent hydrolase